MQAACKPEINFIVSHNYAMFVVQLFMPHLQQFF